LLNHILFYYWFIIFTRIQKSLKQVISHTFGKLAHFLKFKKSFFVNISPSCNPILMNFFLNCRTKLGLQNKKMFIKFGLLDAEIFTKTNFLSFSEKCYFWLKVHYDLYTRFPEFFFTIIIIITIKILIISNFNLFKEIKIPQTLKDLITISSEISFQVHLIYLQISDNLACQKFFNTVILTLVFLAI
jgi:hypothetical protein